MVPLLVWPAVAVLFHEPSPPVGSGGKPFDPDGRPGLNKLVVSAALLVLLSIWSAVAVLLPDPALLVGTDEPPDPEGCLVTGDVVKGLPEPVEFPMPLAVWPDVVDPVAVVFDPVSAGPVVAEAPPVDEPLDDPADVVPAVPPIEEESLAVPFHEPEPAGVVEAGVAVPLLVGLVLGGIAVPSAESVDAPEAEVVDEPVTVSFLFAVEVMPTSAPVVSDPVAPEMVLLDPGLVDVAVETSDPDPEPAEACGEDVPDDPGGLYSEVSVGCPKPPPLVASVLVDDFSVNMHSHWLLLAAWSRHWHG